MIIKGLQKTTLIDYPGKVACTLFLFGCNFRCGFCHNPELVVNNNTVSYTEDEILSFLKKRKLYLDGVCITGGEPLISLKEDFLRKIKLMGFMIKLDTNGSFPERLQKLINDKLIDYIAMDIKSDKKHYIELANPLSHFNINDIEKSIKIISSFKDYEFRTTVLYKYHSIEEIKRMFEWLKKITNKKMKRFYLQAFKNNGKFVDMNFLSEKNTSEDYLNSLKKIAEHYFENVGVRA